MDIPRRKPVPISEIVESNTRRRLINLSAWQLCEKLTIHQAALLILGEDPADSTWASETPGYEPWVAAIVTAAESGTIKGVRKYKSKMRSDGTFFTGDETDPLTSTIDVASLKGWLSAKGKRPAVFFPEVTESPNEPLAMPPYLNKGHPRFAPKLAAAIEAWQAMDNPDDLDLGKTPRNALEVWLTRNAARLGLVSANGTPFNQTIENIATIANWNTRGGAPRTGQKLSRR